MVKPSLALCYSECFLLAWVSSSTGLCWLWLWYWRGLEEGGERGGGGRVRALAERTSRSAPLHVCEVLIRLQDSLAMTVRSATLTFLFTANPANPASATSTASRFLPVHCHIYSLALSLSLTAATSSLWHLTNVQFNITSKAE